MSQAQKKAPSRDFELAIHGSINLLIPITTAAHEWVDQNLPDNRMYWCGGIVIEPRYTGPVLDGIAGDGLLVG